VDSSPSPVAYVEGDTFWHFIVKSEGVAPKAKVRMHNARIVMQAMMATAVRFARGGYETVLDFTIGPWFLQYLPPTMQDVPFDYVILCPSEAVCAARAGARGEGQMPDYAPYRELHAAFSAPGAFERHAIRSDTADAKELAAQIRAGLATGTYRVDPATFVGANR
jgi:hypothetical protein